MFLSSLLDPRYEWFYKDLVAQNQLDSMLVIEDDLETMIGYFRTACIKNSIPKAIVVSFSEFLTAHKDSLCVNPRKNGQGASVQKQQSLNDSLEQQKKFKMFIQRFFHSIEQN